MWQRLSASLRLVDDSTKRESIGKTPQEGEMSDEERRGGRDRRQIHEECVVHSGTTKKLNINIFLNALGVILIAVVLVVIIDATSTIRSYHFRFEAVERELGELRARGASLERISFANHPEGKP